MSNKNPADAHVVYRIYGHNGVLLYVGCTSELEKRLTVHANERAWYGHAATITVQHFADYPSASAAESEAIREELPAWNVIGNGGSPFERRQPPVVRPHVSAYVARHARIAA